MQRTLAAQHRTIGEGHQLVEPGPHQHVLEDVAERLVDTQPHDLALTGCSGVIERRERSDGRVDAANEGVLVAVELERRRVDVARGSGDTAQRFGDESGRLEVLPGARASEGGDVDDG